MSYTAKCLVFCAALVAGAGSAEAQGFNGLMPQYGQPGWGIVQPIQPFQPFQPFQPMPQPAPSWTGQRVGSFDYWNSSNGQNVTCQRVGSFTYCN